MGNLLARQRSKSQSTHLTNISSPQTGNDHLSSTVLEPEESDEEPNPLLVLCATPTNRLLCGFDSGHVEVRDTDMKCVLRYQPHERPITAISSTLGNVYTASRDCSITCAAFSQDDGGPPSQLWACQDAHAMSVTALAVSEDGSFVASGSRDTFLKLWDGATGGELGHFKASRNLVTCVKFLGNDQVIQGSEDLQLRILRVPSMEVVRVFKEFTYFPLCIAIDSSHPELCATGTKGFDGVGSHVKVWDVQSGALVSDLAGHQHDVVACHFFSSVPVTEPPGEAEPSAGAENPAPPRRMQGSFVVSASKDGSVRLWDLQSASLVSETLVHYNDSQITDMCCLGSEPSLRFAVGTFCGKVEVVELSNNQLQRM